MTKGKSPAREVFSLGSKKKTFPAGRQVIDKFKPVDILVNISGVGEDKLLVRMKKEEQRGCSLYYESANQDV